MSKEGSDQPVTIYCTEKTSIAEFRKRAAELCKDRPGFAGETDITLTCENRKLFSAMTMAEAGLKRGSQVVWSCRVRMPEKSETEAVRESARAKNLRLEAEFGDGRIVDACDDGGFWRGQATKNVTEEEFHSRPEDLPSTIPVEDEGKGKKKKGKIDRILF